jgi:adenylate cyclase
MRETDSRPGLLKVAKLLREVMPGDSALGDPLDSAKDSSPGALARTVARAGASRASVTRELGLGALQVWQSVSEAQGRGRGEAELSILFTDLVGFSEWALDAGDDAVLELLRDVIDATEEAIDEQDGEVVKRLGDGVMAVFDDPVRGVRAAHVAVAQVAEIRAEGYTPALRAGMHVGKPRKLRGDYLGVDVNVAARVADGAKGGQLLVSGVAVERLEAEGFAAKRLRRFKAKGAPKDLEVHEVEAAPSS